MSEILMECRDVKKYFQLRSTFWKSKNVVHAVDGIDIQIERGKTFGLVGESGCGKTTLGLLILKLLEPTAGEVIFENKNIFKLKRSELKKIRRNMQIVFQDPNSSLNLRMNVQTILNEPLRIHGVNKNERKEKVLEILKEVGLKKDDLKRFPHEFSGGQKQRIAIARAIILKPKFIVLDEPTSALDVSIQAKILNLLKGLKRNLGFSYLFISHDLSVVKNVSEKMAVMYLGKIVESGLTEELFKSPKHPYTQALLSSIPNPNPRARSLIKHEALKGTVPSPVNPPSGCRFHTRCDFKRHECEIVEPKFININGEHIVACHLIS